MYSDKAFFLTKIDQAELDTVTGQSDDNLISAIESADDLINGYLRARINTLPLTVVPDTIRVCSFDIAMVELYGRTAPNKIPDFRIKKRDDQIDWLKDVSKGNVVLFPEVTESSKETFLFYGGFDTVMTRRG